MFRRLLLLTFSILAVCALGMAQEPQIGQVSIDELPAEVSEKAKALLGQNGVSVELEGEVAARFWLRKELPSAETASSELGVSFGKVEKGTFVGIVELAKVWADYKENAISPGTYTLRYGVMPADGNHMGVSTYRDFLLLIPAQNDTEVERAFNLAEMLIGSSEVTNLPHPAVLALFPIWEDVTDPKMVKNDVDQWTLAFKFGEQIMGLVVSGHGEL